MPNLVNTGTARLEPAKVGATVPLKLTLNLGASGAGVLAPGKVVVLAVYDLAQYLANQRRLAGGFREVTDEFFKGRNARGTRRRTFDGPLQDHVPKAGTGVLFLAELEFDKKTIREKERDPATGNEQGRERIVWFVKKVVRAEPQQDPAYRLRVEMQAATDPSGKPLASGVVDRRAIGSGGAARPDFELLTEHGAVQRSLTFRFLDHERKTVLLSQLDPDHNPMVVPLKITYSREQPLVLGAAAPAITAGPVGITAKKKDVTGWYVQSIDPADAKKDSFDVVAPSSLWLHQAGRHVVGWYFPVRFGFRAARLAGRRIFPEDVDRRIPSDQRIAFVVLPRPDGVDLDTPGADLRFPIEAFFRKDEGADPDLLRTRNDANGSGTTPSDPGSAAGTLVVPEKERVKGEIRFVVETLLLDGKPFGEFVMRVELFLGGSGTPFLFRLVGSDSRLAWSTVKQIGRDNRIPEAKRGRVFRSLVDGLVEPTPPGTLAAITGTVTSPTMRSILEEFVANGTDPTIRRKVEGQLNTLLEGLAEVLKQGASRVPDELVAHVRSLAARRFVQKGGSSRSFLELLDEIAGGMLEREVRRKTGIQAPKPLDPGRPDDEDYVAFAGDASFRGFSAFNFRRQKKFIYRFEFKPKALTANFHVILKGSAGAFLVTISKLDAQGKPIAGLQPMRFVGVFAGGSFGVSWSLDVTGLKPGSGNTAQPQTSDIRSDVDIDLIEFRGARFVFFAQHTPGFAVSAGPGIGGGASPIETVFSLTVGDRSPPVILETVMKEGFKPKVKTPGAADLKRYVEKVAEAAKTGDPKKMPAAEGNGALYALSLCTGILMTETDANELQRAPSSDTLVSKLLDAPFETNARVLGAHFPKQSAALGDGGRQMLELRIATLRKLFEYPGWMDVEGTSSPEWTGQANRGKAKDLNLELSQKRAETVRDAMFAALGQPGAGVIPNEKDIQVMGKGSTPFDPEFTDELEPEGSGRRHLHPFSPALHDPKTRDEAHRRVSKDKKDFYPTLRRVDIVLNGVFTLRLFGD